MDFTTDTFAQTAEDVISAFISLWKDKTVGGTNVLQGNGLNV